MFICHCFFNFHNVNCLFELGLFPVGDFELFLFDFHQINSVLFFNFHECPPQLNSFLKVFKYFLLDPFGLSLLLCVFVFREEIIKSRLTTFGFVLVDRLFVDVGQLMNLAVKFDLRYYKLRYLTFRFSISLLKSVIIFLYSAMCICTIFLFGICFVLIFFARLAYFRVLIVSSNYVLAGEMFAIITVLQFPPKESFNNRVNLLSL